MAHQGKFDLVCERLRALAAAGSLPQNAARHATGLLQRLETPVRIAFVGPPDGRRTEIINGILGAPILPNLRSRPTLELRYGEQDVNRATLADGRTRDLGDLSDGVGADVLFLSLTRKDPQLKRTCILDVVTDGSPRELRMALKWAAARADIFVWCSRFFTDTERQVWQGVDERLMDHAFLALWGAERELRAPNLREHLGGAFLDVVPVGLEDAPAGQGGGLAALADALGRHVELGHQADSDSALLFLRKYGVTFEAPPPPDARAAPPAPAPAAAPPAAEAAAPVPGPDPAAASRLAVLCGEGAAILRERARGLMKAVAAAEPMTPAAIIGHCRETVEHLTGMLDARGAAADPAAAALSGRLMDAEELLVLLEIEGEGGAETDGVCLMLQLRRAFEAGAAA